jgi:hypothetical protein
MSPDVAAAIDDLRQRGILTEARAALPRRVARGELLSVRGELGWLLYGGVSLVVAGAGLLVKQNLAAIGPLGIALGIGAAALVSLGWAARRAPAFSWGEAQSPSLARDYLLLLGLLLAGADLAFIEVQFTPLGAEWPWHFFIMSLVALAFAVRYDSRVALSLALSSFAAWRGVSVSFQELGWWWESREALRVNMIVCGLAFVGLGALFVRTRRKAHFEPVATHLGWLLVLGALFAGQWQSDRGGGLAYAAMLLTVGGGLTWWALRRGRFPLFAMGVVGAYAGLCGFVLRGLVPGITLVFAWFAFSSLGVLAALVLGHRAIRRKP